MSEMEMREHRAMLNMIKGGMTVIDAAGDEIGVVENVYLGTRNDEAIEAGNAMATSPAVDLSDSDTFVEHMAKALIPMEIPEELAKRLLRSGYVRVNVSGLFAGDRFVMPDQIASVTDGRVRLNTPLDRLYKP
jgi:hypothetical protein